MIDIGSIAYGPEVERLPILGELERLSQELRASPEPEPSVEIAFVLPGSLGGADFQGFKLDRRRGGARNVIIYVDVPASVVIAKQPLADLVRLADAAIRFGVDNVGTKGGRLTASDGKSLLLELSRAAARLGVPQPVASDHPEGRDHRAPAHSSATSDAEATVEVTLVATNPGAIEEAFIFEQTLADSLATGSVGSIDGNEIGGGEFTIHAMGRDLERLRTAIVDLVRERWTQGATVRLHDATGNEVETLIL